MSPGTSSQAGLAEYIATLLAETDLRPARLRLELPERALTAAAPGEATVEAEAPSAVLEALAALGVSLALDDVGTGLSSIESLARLPLDVLKLAPSALDSAVLVRAI